MSIEKIVFETKTFKQIIFDLELGIYKSCKIYFLDYNELDKYRIELQKSSCFYFVGEKNSLCIENKKFVKRGCFYTTCYQKNKDEFIIL